MAPWVALSRIAVLNLRDLRSHKLRVITSLLVITVSSVLLVAVLSAYGSVTDSVRKLSQTVSGSADFDVTAVGDSGLDASLEPAIRDQVPQARVVAPLIQRPIFVDGKAVTVLGSDISILSLGGAVSGALGSATGGPTQVPDADPATSVAVGDGLGYAVGQQITLGGVTVTVAQVVKSSSANPINNGRFVAALLPLAQKITGMQGRLDSILIRKADGVSKAQLRIALEKVVAGRAGVNDPAFRATQVEDASTVTRDSTLLVSMISLVIATFLVFNTMNMTVASRRKTMAMIRAIGGRRLPLVRDLIAESALFGVVGGLLGVPLGALAGWAVIKTLPQDTTGQVGATVTYSLPLYVVPVAVGLCVAACVAASLLAARSVFSLSPIEAMVPGEMVTRDRRAGWLEYAALLVGVLAVIGGFVVAFTVTGRVVFLAAVAVAIGSLLVFFALSPILVAATTWLARQFSGPGRLASVTTERSPRRTWATLMTVSVAVSVGIGTSGAMSNLIGSVSDALDGLGDPDVYVSSQPVTQVPAGPILDPAVKRAVAAVPGVGRVVGGQWAYLNYEGKRILMQGLTPGVQAPFVKRADPAVLRQVLDGKGIIISKVLGRTLGKGVGDTVTFTTPTGYQRATILQAVDYVALDSGTGAISNTLLSQWFSRPGDSFLQITYAPGADQAAVRAAVKAAALRHTDRIFVFRGAETVSTTRAQVQQLGSFTIAIQWIVAGVAAVALLNTLLLSVVERRRELGVLRAMGASRQFISRMVLAEAAAIAGVGSVLGVGSGELLHFISNQVLEVTTAVNITYRPQLSTALYVVAAFLLCFAGSFLPAARAARMNISESILEE
ncbi:FtsX-like permease family protein [Williamsia sp. CHRR-6]|uniref:FtsX-like permease family protein n=1 Tax=Williamsia sp. CHRR-6 TaxID=2835871 RepID=UPI001BDA9B39|nr:FtsX-like permease family protein [Williamsia sp. CHRR-6]MBT0565953.1 ABC transporter permease [Williamsia sp. CHRR-6]